VRNSARREGKGKGMGKGKGKGKGKGMERKLRLIEVLLHICMHYYQSGMFVLGYHTVHTESRCRRILCLLKGGPPLYMPIHTHPTDG
jgi:hypothetical protein